MGRNEEKSGAVAAFLVLAVDCQDAVKVLFHGEFAEVRKLAGIHTKTVVGTHFSVDMALRGIGDRFHRFVAARTVDVADLVVDHPQGLVTVIHGN